MDRQKLFWMFIVGTVAAAAIISAKAAAPKQPVMMTFQEESAACITELSEAVPADTKSYTSYTTAAVKTTKATAKTKPETKNTTVSTAAELQRDLNLAAETDLMRVSGIGEVLAGEIVRYRSELGGFTYRNQLLDISGIGDVLLSRIMSEFEITDEQPPPEPETVPESAPESQQTETTAEVQTAPEAAQVYHYNVNTVTREELLTLPDMTEECADAILAVRKRIGRYHEILEIMLVNEKFVEDGSESANESMPTYSISWTYFKDVLCKYLYVEGDPYSHLPE